MLFACHNNNKRNGQGILLLEQIIYYQELFGIYQM